MIKNSTNNLELVQMIKNFIYDTKFKNLGIFSKQYLSSVLYSMNENNTDSLFSLAFGDFDGLRALNDKYSIPVGDKAMYDSLKIIKDILPENTSIARAAGDEFIFLSTSLSKKDWDELIINIVDTLDHNHDKLYGLNITMSAMDSNIYPTFKELYDLAELDVGRKKHISQQNEFLSKEEILNDKIINDFRKYFNYYRLNEGTSKSVSLPNSYFKVLSNSLIDIILNRFENADTPLDLYMERLENTLISNDTFLEYLGISKESAYAIHELINNEYDFTDYDELNPQELENVLKFLIRDPLTGEFSKTYFKNYLCSEIKSKPEQKISVQLFDLVHLKLSNDTITHVKTDQKISELFSHIVYGLRSNIDYSDFIHDSGNYLISYGGKLISIQKGDFTIPEEEIVKILDKAKTNQRILDIVTAKKSGVCSELNNIINELSENCIDQKHDLKVNKITSKETIVPLNIALNDSISYFIDNYPEPYSLPSKQYLVRSLWTGMCNVIGERYPNMKLNSYNSTEKQECENLSTKTITNSQSEQPSHSNNSFKDER